MTSSIPTESEPSSKPGLAGRFQPGRIVPVATSGLIVAIYEVVAATSMAALIFSGPLSDFVAAGIGLALFAAIVTGAATAMLGSLPGTVGGIQDAPAAITAVMAASIVLAMPAGASAEATFVTVVVTIAITSLLTGACLLGLGYFQIGNLVRFLPYPVVGGFLAATGWLLFAGGLAMMSGITLSLANLSALFEPGTLLTWLPGLLWAVVALVAMRRYRHPLLLPALIVLAILLFYGAAWLGGVSLASLDDQGLLLGTIADGQMWPPVSFADLRLVSWPVVLGQSLSVATVILLSMVGVLLNASGLEVMFGKNTDLNRELRAAGAGNLLSGLGGGLVGFQQLSGTALALDLKGVSRWAGLIAVAICALILFLGGSALSYFPKGLLGGILLLVGLSFLYEWLVEAWPKLPKQDYAVVVIIVVVTATVGFLQAVIVGLLIAVILFAISYSWADVVRAEMSGATYRSRVTRSRPQQAVLDQVAGRLALFQLQGFIFFGTAHNIADRVKSRIDDPAREKPKYVILDFSRVSGLDTTASISFSKLIKEASGRDIALAISAPKATIWRQLMRAGLCEPGDGFRVFSTLDKGVEWCEEQLLAELGPAQIEEAASAPEQFVQILGDAADITALMPYMERQEVAAGERLIAQGDSTDTLYFVESGRLTAQLTSSDGHPKRLQSMGSGHVLGEVGFYLGGNRTADVLADEASVVYRLSKPDLQRMQHDDPSAASTLHHLVAILLAERVAFLTTVANNEDHHSG